MRKTLIVFLSLVFCTGLAAWAGSETEVLDPACATPANVTLVPTETPAFDNKAGLVGIGGCTQTCLAENRECEESGEVCAIVFEICMDLCENPPQL